VCRRAHFLSPFHACCALPLVPCSLQTLLLEAFATERRERQPVLDRPTIRNVLSMLVELGINSSAVSGQDGGGAASAAVLVWSSPFLANLAGLSARLARLDLGSTV
jgi:hypothetical protein